MNLDSYLKNDMIELSLTSSQLFLKEIKEKVYKPDDIYIHINKNGNKLINATNLYTNYKLWCESNKEKNIQSNTRFGKECKKTLKFIRKKDAWFEMI